MRRWLSSLWQRPHHPHDQPLSDLPHRGFIAIDLETTGLDSQRDRIVALAALRFIEDRAVPELVTLVNPGCSIPAASTRIHGINDAMVTGALAEASAVERLDAISAEQVIVGHGIAFDMAVLARARGAVNAPRPPRFVLCTQRLAASLYPGWADWSLEAVCERLGVAPERRHTADGDAELAGRLLLRLLPHLEQRGIRTLAEALWLQDASVARTR
jgi:DNA polymerase III alpha subunit (gram-positive type)